MYKGKGKTMKARKQIRISIITLILMMAMFIGQTLTSYAETEGDSASETQALEMTEEGTEATTEAASETFVQGNASAQVSEAGAAASSNTKKAAPKYVYNARSDIKAGSRVWFFNMECGDFILVESNGHWGLIDSGERSARSIRDSDGRIYGITWSYTRTGEEAMKWAIEHLGVTHLDFILVTHPHSDHMGGVPYIARMCARDKKGKITPLVDKSTVYIRKPYLHISDLNDDLAGATNPKGWHNQAYWYQAEKAMTTRGAVIFDISQGQVVSNNAQNKNSYNKMIKAIRKVNPVFKNLKYSEGSYNDWYDDRFDLTFNGLNISLYNLFITATNYDSNVNSIAAVIRYGQQKIFTGGDLNVDQKVEQKVAQAIANNFGKFEVIKADHHLYDGSNSKKMLDLFQPKKMIVTNTIAYTPSPCPAEDYAREKFGTVFYMVGQTPRALAFDLKNGSIKQYAEKSKTLGNASGLIKKAGQKGNGWAKWTNGWNPEESGWLYYQNGRW